MWILGLKGLMEGTLRSDDSNGNGNGNENVRSTRGFISKTTTLRVQHTFCEFLYRLCTTTSPNFTFHGGSEQVKSKFFLFLHLDIVLSDSTPGEFPFV